LRRPLRNMSTDPHTNRPAANNGYPVHDDVSFETRDVSVSPILKFLASLGITVVISYLITLGIYKGLKGFWTNEYAAPVPSQLEAEPRTPPEPMLQAMPGHLTDAQQDLRNKIKVDTDANNQLGWVDQKAGIAEIPVSDAMQLIVQKGLPAVNPPQAEKK
jgi:hypothetical protein